MKFDTADPAYQDLLSLVLRSGVAVVPFVGAGLSAYGEPEERLPLWEQLLERLVAEGRHLDLIPKSGDSKIDYALRRGNYIEATDRLLTVLGEPTFRRVIEHELDDTGKPVPPAISALVTIDWSLIITTNLDRLIARAYLDKRKRPLTAITGAETRRLAEAIAETLTSSETTLAQIHGSIDAYESWRLTRTHYTQLLQDPAYLTALNSLFMRRVFFVGFGLQDEDFDFVFKTITSIYPPGVGEFYALIPRSRQGDAGILSLTRRGGLRPIFYDVEEETDAIDPFGGHRAVYECLGHLASKWAAATVDLEVTLKYFPEPDSNMVDREEVDLLAKLVAPGGSVAQVVGLGGLGKTSLIQQFLHERRPEIAATGYESVFGCSFYRADIGQFTYDMALAMVGPESRPLPQQVDRICAHVRGKRTLLVLDGLEAILDSKAELRSPYVLQIVESVVAGEGAVVVTSRVQASGGPLSRAHLIEVQPFSPEQILDFMGRWGLDRLGEAANRRLVEITAGHPLALRILAGVLQDAPANEAIATIERSAIIDLADEVDPLRENRLARVFGSYFHHLNEAEIAFLDCLTVFERPAAFTLIASAFTPAYPDTAINGPLVERDLRPLITRLLERRLLTASPVGEISCHPTVREYFAKHAGQEGRSLSPIHRYLAAEALRKAPWQPDAFEEATPLISAGRHAAKCQDWTLFDDLFRNRLMRGFRDYLCDTLGAWDETLGLAMFGDDPEFPARLTGQPGYYPITVARCLKHLGRTSESRTKYVRTLKQVASSKDPDTAMYVNNLMTLLAWRGELTSADWLVELNVRALSWIDEPWKHRWQVEHGFSSIAYLKMLQGDLAAAETLFDHSEQAWGDFLDERPWPQINDYYSLHRSELTLLIDPEAHDQALAEITSLLEVPDVHEWPESLCRGHIQAAGIHIDRSTREADPSEITRAEERLEQARLTTAGMNVADVAIAHHLTRLKVELAKLEVGADADLGTVELKDLVDRITVLVSTSGLYLATPDVTAARGVLAYLDGSLDQAEELHERAMQQCGRQGNALAQRSPRSLVGWLGRQLGRRAMPEAVGSTTELVGLVGAQLSPKWMVERLDALPGSS